MDDATIALYERRIDSCVRASKAAEKGTWAHTFWMQTASAILRKLRRNS
jgi:hypothetical protein